MTWLLVGTTRTWYGQLPGTEATQENLGYEPEEWRQQLQAQIRKGEDWPLAQVPRERLDRFRPQVRTKVWSLMLWLMARHPDKFVSAMFAFPSDHVGLPEECAAVWQQQLGIDVPTIEAEWREWVLGTSRLAKATRL